MVHRRSDAPAPGGPVTEDERARAAGTADPGVAGDTHVAGPRPAPVRSAETGRPAPSRRPDRAPGRDGGLGTGPDTRPDFRPDIGRDAAAGESPREPRGDSPGNATGQAAPAGRAPERPGRPEGAAGPHALPDRLVDPAEADRLRTRFRELQSAFVDDPRAAVRDADGLVTEATEVLARALAGRREALADGLGTDADASGGGADTERLRLALRAYRDLLDRVAGL
ncbi:hypothetical protein [Actinomadura sediminis]|uniref:Uncharacterized protein n=1 Tax=Actinomadura sediminis TaxID=1038904 RepID=A0ABW3EYH9_9ACTN